MSSLRTLLMLARTARPPALWLVVAIALLIASAGIATLPPVFAGAIVDALGHGGTHAVLSNLAILSAVALLSAILTGGGSAATSFVRETMLRNLRRLLLEKAHLAQLESLQAFSFGALSNRIADDVDVLAAKFEFGLFPSIQAVFAAAATIVAMLLLDRRLALVSIAASLITVAPPRLLASMFQRLQAAVSANRDERVHIVAESITPAGALLFRHPRARGWLFERFSKSTSETLRLRMRSSFWEGLSGLLATIASLTGPIAILATGSYLILHHALTPGVVVTFLMYHGRLGAPLGTLTNLPIVLAGGRVIAGRILEIIDMPPELPDGATPAGTGLELQGISLVRGERVLLRDAHAAIPSGTHVALAGPSGTGKSTLASLLVRYSSPSCGEIALAGHPLPSVARDVLRETIVLVAQDPAIVDGTIEENLFLFAPQRTSERLDEILRVTRFDQVIAQSPEGLSRRIGPRGTRLSGGERQRLCLARALLAQPGVLVLDESLSALDEKMEGCIIRDLRQVMEGKTLIVISHRTAALVLFETRWRIEAGQLIDDTREAMHV